MIRIVSREQHQTFLLATVPGGMFYLAVSPAEPRERTMIKKSSIVPRGVRMKGTPLTQEQWSRLAAQAQYDSGTLAHLCQVSPRHLQRVFLCRFDQTPTEWLEEQRLGAAQQLLQQGFSVKEVARELGYKHTSHFCRRFRSHKGMKPSQFALLTLAYEMCRSGITNVAMG